MNLTIFLKRILMGILIIFEYGKQVSVLASRKSEQQALNNFLNMYKNAANDLKWIRDTFRVQRSVKDAYSLNEKNTRNHRKVVGGDDWYDKFRKNEGRMCDIIVNQKDVGPFPPENTSLVNGYSNNPENDVNRSKVETRALHISTNKPFLLDQIEKSKNDLSHEADYKLSKFEQENEEKMRSIKQADKSFLTTENVDSTIKRNINPDNEINLKINSRLECKGLPSVLLKKESYTHSGIFFDEIQKNEEPEHRTSDRDFDKIPNYNLFKRQNAVKDDDAKNEFRFGRKLLSTDLLDKSEQKSKNQKRHNDYGQQIINRKIIQSPGQSEELPKLILIQNEKPKITSDSEENKIQENIIHSSKFNETDKDTDYEDTFFDETEEPPFNVYSNDNKTICDEFDELIESAKPEKNKNEDDEECNDEDSTTCGNDDATDSTTESKAHLKKPQNTNSSLDETPQINIKLEINVKNTSIPMKLEHVGDKIKLINRKKRKAHRTLNLNELITGRLPNQLVKAIFQLVQENENFKTFIAPSLDKTKFTEIIGASNSKLNVYKNKDNEDLLKSTDTMMKIIVENINNLIDQELKMRTCIPLTTDLEMFLKKLTVNQKHNMGSIAMILEQDDSNSENRFKRSLSPEFRINIIRIDASFKTIQNLLDEFNKLSTNNKLKLRKLKMFLEQHLILLDELQQLTKSLDKFDMNGDRQGKVKRNAMDETRFIRNWNLPNDENRRSTEFIKLVKTAEFIRSNTAFDIENSNYYENDILF